MTETTIFAGLDVHKKTIAVATVAAHASASVQFYGTISNTPEAIPVNPAGNTRPPTLFVTAMNRMG